MRDDSGCRGGATLSARERRAATSLAGVTVTALALPSAMAYGGLAGLSPVNGLYALLGPTLAYVLLGSSRRLVIGPEGSVSTLVAAAVLPLAVAGNEEAVELASMLALLVAVCFLLARALRLGWVADYLSRPVLIGYLNGVAVGARDLRSSASCSGFRSRRPSRCSGCGRWRES